MAFPYTLPTTVVDGTVVGASAWNQDIIDNIRFLRRRPFVCSAQYFLSSLGTGSVMQDLPLVTAPNQTLGDPIHMIYSRGVATVTRIKPGLQGVWLGILTVSFAAVAAGHRAVAVTINNVQSLATVPGSSAATQLVMAAGMFYTSEGTTVQCQARQDSGAGMSVTANLDLVHLSGTRTQAV